MRTDSIFAGRRGRMLIGLLLAEFAGAIQIFAVSTVLPLAARDLHGAHLYGATLAGTSVTIVAVLPLGPSVAARWGRPTALAASTSLYVAGTLLAASAPTMLVLLVGQVVRGIGGGLLAGFALSAMARLYPEDLRVRVMGLVGSVWLLPSLVGPTLSAGLAVAASWRVAMLVGLPFVVGARILMGLYAAMLPPATAKARPPTWLLLTLPGGLLLAILGSGAASLRGIGVLLIGLILIGLAVGARLRAVTAGYPGAAFAFAVMLAMCVSFYGTDGLLSLAIVTGLGAGVGAAGLVVSASSVAWSVASLIGTRGARLARMAAWAMVAIAAGSAGQIGAQQAGGGGVVVAAVGAVVAGAGIGVAYPIVSAAPFESVPAELTDDMASLVALAESLSGSVASLLGGTTYAVGVRYGVRTSTSLSVAFGLFAAVGLGAAVLRSSARRSGA